MLALSWMRCIQISTAILQTKANDLGSCDSKLNNLKSWKFKTSKKKKIKSHKNKQTGTWILCKQTLVVCWSVTITNQRKTNLLILTTRIPNILTFIIKDMNGFAEGFWEQ